MKKLSLVILLQSFLFSCNPKDQFKADDRFSPSERDSLLADMITFVYTLPSNATPEARFDKKFRPYYVSQLRKFRFDKYHDAANGLGYFYLIRPARSAEGSLRGVGGKIRLDEHQKIISFEEIFNTPPSDLNTLRERGERLFKEMIKKGNVNDYLSHPDYIEWPDDKTFYDTVMHQWTSKPGV
jgi:hypothetical protein